MLESTKLLKGPRIMTMTAKTERRKKSRGISFNRAKASMLAKSKGRLYGANDYQALIPSYWALETLKVLSERMVSPYLINRNFENIVASHGETVNTRKPNAFTAKRKAPGASLVAQDAVATNIAVVLNQQAYTSFLIDDTSLSKSFLDVAGMFAEPAALALAQQIDRTILGQYPQFIGQSYGGLGQMSTSNAVDYLIGIRTKAETLLWPDENRNLILGSNAEAKILGTSLFNQANTSANGGQTQRTGMMGSRFGFDIFGCQNSPNVVNTIGTTAGAINLSGGYAAGSTSLVINGITGALGNNTWITIAGDYTPQRIVSHTEGSGNTTGLVISPGLQAAVSNSAVITVVTPGQINNSGGYAAGYVGEITYDTTSSAQPKVGQLVSFGIGASPAYYTVLSVPTSATFTLDRPLVAAVADDDKVNFGPGGGFNLAFSRNALMLVNRPLALPMAGTTPSAVRDFNGISIRVVISYDALAEQHRVTLGMLYGIAVLDSTLGAVLYS